VQSSLFSPALLLDGGVCRPKSFLTASRRVPTSAPQVVFSEGWWIGTAAENPEDRRLPEPDWLAAPKLHAKFDFSGRGEGCIEAVRLCGWGFARERGPAACFSRGAAHRLVSRLQAAPPAQRKSWCVCWGGGFPRPANAPPWHQLSPWLAPREALAASVDAFLMHLVCRRRERRGGQGGRAC
jgi:hypothetical protein